MKNISVNVLLQFLFIFAIIDAVMTDIGLRLHLIQELNPIMDFVYTNSTALFYLVKIVLPLSAFLFIRVYRKSRIAVHLITITTVLYLSILVLHCYWFSYFITHY